MKILWPLLDPALFFTLLLAGVAAWSWFTRQTRAARLVAALPLLLFLPLACPPLPELAARRLMLPEPETYLRPGQAELLVVLGGGLDRDGNLATSTFVRTATAVALWRQGVAPRLLCAGVEGPQMAELARTLGVPPEALLVEAHSRSTRENAEFTRAWLLESPSTQAAIRASQRLPVVALVTTPEHLRRASRCFRAAGFTIHPAPAPGPHRPHSPTPLPSFRRAALVGQVAYEFWALVAYRLTEG